MFLTKDQFKTESTQQYLSSKLALSITIIIQELPITYENAEMDIISFDYMGP